MKIKILSFVVFASVTIACQQTGKKSETPLQEKKPYTIDLSEVEYSENPQLLSDFVESIEYIKLSEEPLIPDARLVFLAEDNEKNLYIDFSNNIYKYTPTGEYMKTLLKIGQGPGEIAKKNRRSAFNLDEGYVLVTDYGKLDYCKFTLNGDFIGTETNNMGLVSKNIFAYWKGTELYKYIRNAPYTLHEQVNIDSLYFFNVQNLVTDSVIFKLKNHHFDIKGEIIGPRVADPCFPVHRGVIDDSLFWMKPLNIDTIYCTTDWKDLRALYIIKQHKDAADYTWLATLATGVEHYSMSEIRSKRRLSSIWALKSGLLYTYIKTFDEMGIGFCPADGKAKTFSKLFKNDVDKYCPSIDFTTALYQGTLFQKNSYLYLLVEADKFFEEGAQSPFPDLTEDSNPVVVKLKLK